MAEYKLISELKRYLDAEDRRTEGKNQATAGELGGWTEEGANRIARLISLRHLSKLDTTNGVSLGKPVPTSAGTSHRSEKEEYEAKDSGTWFRARMLALYGPHSTRPWVQMLRALNRGDNEGVTHASHPESQPANS